LRTQIKVLDLTPGQQEYIASNVPVNGRKFLLGLPRVCVEFEFSDDYLSLHVEMHVTEFAALVVVLNEMARTAEAALSPDALPDHTYAQDAAALFCEMNRDR
jgi:hypothetical protein